MGSVPVVTEFPDVRKFAASIEGNLGSWITEHGGGGGGLRIGGGSLGVIWFHGFANTELVFI